ncbi:MAG: HEAT repeat domain-containing protein [Acidobacteriota bacterium]|nr:HEAT repeat domain-containing protein [Acidobacteriota bacterium]
MKCEDAARALPLLVYGELSFDAEDQLEMHLEACADCRRLLEQQRSWMTALDQVRLEPGADLLIASRQKLRGTLTTAHATRATFWDRVRENLTVRLGPVPGIFQPVGALALVLMGFLGARLIPPGMGGRFDAAGLTEPVASRVKYVEQEGPGKVQIVLEETRQRTLTGKLDDQSIQRLLLGAAKDPADPGLRVESVGLLRTSPESSAVRNALLYALQHDVNSGVRLKALEGLKASAGDPEVRQSLSQVLLTDKNPGVRTQVIDLLIQQKEHRMVGVLQELMRKEDNNYVRLRCQRALHDMNASVETY